ncbi:ABC transporter permease [Streptomyces sp. H27-H5]|uniref:ABC transporter permease n=1 Tax=Streptomyces sp. H27-H5 TaxID=2996460 RepID=UPI002270FFA7|nr:ABC transporter permease [Streptomyces sp. H27-H5]MCY0956044.1 ABC transporter permease [Streptomyces sp. H27-H5]
MLSVALRTLRTRWITLVGSFLALSLGVGLIATMGLGLAATLDAPQRQPERFAQAPVVVKGADTLRVTTAAGEHTAVLAHSRGIDPALTRRLAARLSPAVPQVVVTADPAAVRAAVKAFADRDGPGGATAADGVDVRVLTGRDRHLADPDPERDREALLAVNAALGTAGGITGFVSVFVVASTFAFAVAQRRREFALLRTTGAAPGQIRRMVLVEALLLGVTAAAAGCVLGAYGAPILARAMALGGLAPRWFAIGSASWPYHLAFWTGLLVAFGGVVAASWRAGRVGPTEALREAAAETRTMTWGRGISGAALVLLSLAILLYGLLDDPSELLHRKTYLTRPMPLIAACALLFPLAVKPLIRLVGWLPARLPGAGGMLIRENAATGIRRTCAVAAPVLVTVALAGSLLGTTATLNEAKATEIRERTTAPFVLSGNFDPAAVERLRAVPGADLSATSATAVHVLEEGTALVRSEARAADPALLARTMTLPVVAGEVTDLDDDSIIVNEEWDRHTVGTTVEVRLGDGARKTLRIAAVLSVGTGDNGVYLTPANAPGAHVDRIDARTVPGADVAAVATALTRVAEASGGRVFTRDQWVQASRPGTKSTTRLGLLLVLGIALLYTGIGLANTQVMATTERVGEFAALRLAGATRRQVLRLVAGEALLVVLAGAVVGGLVAALNLGGVWGALHLLDVRVPIVVPWEMLRASHLGARQGPFTARRHRRGGRQGRRPGTGGVRVPVSRLPHAPGPPPVAAPDHTARREGGPHPVGAGAVRREEGERLALRGQGREVAAVGIARRQIAPATLQGAPVAVGAGPGRLGQDVGERPVHGRRIVVGDRVVVEPRRRSPGRVRRISR